MSSDEVEISYICRACCNSSPDEKFRSIFKAGRIMGSILTLADIISGLFGQIEISIGDGLPEVICNKCAIQASKSYAFKEQCFKSNNLLREKLKIKSESMEIVLKEDEVNFEDIQDEEDDDEEESVQTVYEISCESRESYEEDSKIEVLQEDFVYGIPIDSDQKEELEENSSETIDEEDKKNIPEKVVFKTSRVPRKKRQPTIENLSFKCKVCDKQLSNAGSFKYHMQLHSDEVPFLCCECGEKFKTKNAYDGHMTTHNNTHTCEVCGKCYRQAGSYSLGYYDIIFLIIFV